MRYQFLRFPEGKAKAVTFSYDDGSEADLRFSDVITKAGLKCTFNICSNEHKAGKVTDEQFEEYVLARGHEIAVHGARHRANCMQRPIEGIKDVLDCRLNLEKRFGRIIRGMAYPDASLKHMETGIDYETIRSYLKDLDIAYARDIGGDNNKFRLPQDWYAWMPTAKHSNPQILEWIDEFLALDVEKLYCAVRMPRLFYMWGHSFEFDRNDNWDLLDRICEKLGGHEDIWYATNIEIYDYVQAYQSLVYSADGGKIYNPTLYTIWMEIDSKEYVIKSGETLCLDTTE
ncbi:MAG: polysaccharide deacetylase family protein [Clostridia bacterium]|nr:polysaccharide deacetylase family protein [Clostridia bacterium]